MEQLHEHIREQQKASWNKFSPGWKKWDELFMDFLKPMGNEIIHSLNPRDDDLVLDVASGTGEPGLSIANKLRRGKVVITDLADDMLAIARDNAVRRGIRNIETRSCDVCELPFADNTFDAVSCRLGFMFFPDTLLAAKEIVRVMKNEGRIAAAVWNIPEKNFWITATMDAIANNMNLPAPPSDAPGMFRCASDGFMQNLFQQAGLRNISVKEVTGKLDCQTSDVYWKVMTEVAAPVVAALSNADDTLKERIRDEVSQAVKQRYPDGNIQVESSALVAYGEK